MNGEIILEISYYDAPSLRVSGGKTNKGQNSNINMIVLVDQSCLTLCNAMDCSPPGYSARNSPGKNTVLDSHSLLQGIFLTQGSNPVLPHCRQILYHPSHQGSHTYVYVFIYKFYFLGF